MTMRSKVGQWLLTLAAVLVLSMCVTARADAAVRIVDQHHPKAGDEGPGTEAAPWKTLQHATKAAQPGDTVLVLPGVYKGPITPASSGTAAKPIVYRAMRDGEEPGGAVVIEDGSPGVDLSKRQYIRFEGFEIRNSDGRGGRGVLMDDGEHLELVGNHIHHTKSSGVVIQRGADCLIEENYIHHIGGTGIHAGGRTYRVTRCRFLRNHIHDNGVEDGIQIGCGDDCELSYNYIHDIWAPPPSHTDGIQLHSDNRNYKVIGNVAHRIRSEGFMIGAEGASGDKSRRAAPLIERNIISDGGGVSLILSSATRGVVARHNTILWGNWRAMWIHNGSIQATIVANLFQSPAGGFHVEDESAEGARTGYNFTAGKTGDNSPGGKRGDPKLVDPKAAGSATPPNARLRPDSPCIDAGPEGSDIGALEYPNVYYVDARHPAATDRFYGYRALPFKTIAKACSVAREGETIVLRAGTYRETIAPQADGLTIRAMKGERVVVSGADRITGWRREGGGAWSASLAEAPMTVLRDGQEWTDFAYDAGAKRITVTGGGDARLHVFETIVRRRAVDLGGRKNVKLQGIETAHALADPAAQ